MSAKCALLRLSATAVACLPHKRHPSRHARHTNEVRLCCVSQQCVTIISLQLLVVGRVFDKLVDELDEVTYRARTTRDISSDSRACARARAAFDARKRSCVVCRVDRCMSMANRRHARNVVVHELTRFNARQSRVALGLDRVVRKLSQIHRRREVHRHARPVRRRATRRSSEANQSCSSQARRQVSNAEGGLGERRGDDEALSTRSSGRRRSCSWRARTTANSDA